MKKFNCMLMIAVVSGLGWGGEVSLNEALDSDELVFEVIEDGGDCVSCNAIWVGQTGESYDGKDAVKVSGREGQLRISNFSGPGVLTLRRCTVYASIWRSSASIWANGDGERLYEHSTLDETGNTIWFQDTLEFFNSGDHSAFVVYSDSDAGTAYQSYGLVDQVTWTPITGPMTIALISDGQEVDSLQVEPGTRFPDLCLNDPPPRNGWTFVGWYRDAEYRYPIAAETEDGIWVSAKSEYVPLTGCALYAKWIKPLAAVDANISISCEGGNPWQLTDLVAPNGGSVLQLQMDPKFSEDVWHGRYFNGEYENGSTLHLQFPGTGFLSFYTMGLVGFSGSEHNRGYSNGLWSRKSCALVSKGEDVSWSWNAWWPWNGGYSFEQVLSVGGIVFEPYGPQATFSDWIEKYYNYGPSRFCEKGYWGFEPVNESGTHCNLIG